MKVEKFRGKTEEEIKNISIDEFLNMVSAGARRNLKRMNLNFRYKKLVDKVRKLKSKGGIKKPIKTHLRDAVIIPEWLGIKFLVHNGKDWKPVEITMNKLGRRLGDFSHTTGKVIHSGPGVGATRGSKFVPLK
ncbi:MAG: ribosomal protein S19 family protein [Candidatus Anstonellales archaeon]